MQRCHETLAILLDSPFGPIPHSPPVPRDDVLRALCIVHLNFPKYFDQYAALVGFEIPRAITCNNSDAPFFFFFFFGIQARNCNSTPSDGQIERGGGVRFPDRVVGDCDTPLAWDGIKSKKITLSHFLEKFAICFETCTYVCVRARLCLSVFAFFCWVDCAH